MYKIEILVLGKFKEKAYQDLEHVFLKRIQPFAKVVIKELPEVPYSPTFTPEKALELEAVTLQKNLSKDALVVLLDVHGSERSSKDFAEFLDRVASLGRTVSFIVGSGYGVSDTIKGMANHIVSFGPLTFPHNLARILLEEQLYRACTIIHHKAYHKE